MACAAEPPSALSAAVPIRRDEIRANREALLALAGALRTARRPSPRAVALAHVLLCDGGSPAFAPGRDGALERWIAAAAAALGR